MKLKQGWKSLKNKSLRTVVVDFWWHRTEIMMTINSGYILRNIYGKNILMPVCRNEAGDTPILLNDIAAEIWNKAKESGDRKALCDAIAELYGLQEGTVEKSAVRVFIDELIKMRLIYD